MFELLQKFEDGVGQDGPLALDDEQDEDAQQFGTVEEDDELEKLQTALLGVDLGQFRLSDRPLHPGPHSSALLSQTRSLPAPSWNFSPHLSNRSSLPLWPARTLRLSFRSCSRPMTFWESQTGLGGCLTLSVMRNLAISNQGGEILPACSRLQ